MKFNPLTKYDSIVESIDNLSDTNISTYPLVKKALACNSALDRAYSIIFQSVDTKNYDDKNYTTLPQGTYDINLGERNISISKDDEGGDILKIYRVIAKNSDGNWYELRKTDIRSKDSDILAYGTETGKISAYDWVGTSIVFDVAPDEDIADGLKVFYARNSTYFTDTDTDKEPGLPALYHDYLVYYSAWQYAMKKGLQRKDDLRREVDRLEISLSEFASSQSLEENKRLKPYTVNAE